LRPFDIVWNRWALHVGDLSPANPELGIRMIASTGEVFFNTLMVPWKYQAKKRQLDFLGGVVQAGRGEE